MQAGPPGQQDPINQQEGNVNLNTIYHPAPIDKRKADILKHQMEIDKFLLCAFFGILIAGILIAKFESNSVVKTIGSAMAGGAIGALANRMKDGKLNPD
jgi:hypothetical protein